MRQALSLLAIVALLVVVLPCANANPAGSETALKATEITNKIFPDQVFFRGQVAPVQMRNTGGVHFTDDTYVLAGLIDNSGYASDIRQKYQAYFISEVTLDMGGQKLAPGAYGVGFVQGKFVVMDLGAHDLFRADASRDADMKRPVPLQVVGASGKYRLYAGREFVELARPQ